MNRTNWKECLIVGMSLLSPLWAKEDPATIPLKEAIVIEKTGTVEILEDDNSKSVEAALGDVIKDKRILRTGKQSRAEVEFKDASISRLGANTIFSFDYRARTL